MLSHNLTQIQSGYGTWVIADGVSIDNRYGGGGSGTWVSPTYVMYNADGTPTGGPTHGTGTLAEARFAQIGQGFMVRGNGNTNPVEFNNSMRRYIPADYFNNFKNAAESPSTFQATFASAFTQPGPDADFYTVDATLRFHIEINESYTRDMVLMLSDNSTKGEDRGFDGRHPSVISVGDAYWKIEDTPQPFVIQTRPFDYMELIPLGLRMRNGSTSFKIKLAEMKGFDNLSEAHGSEIRIYLFDQINNQYQRIGLEHTATINHNGNAGNIEDRYFIVYRRGINQDIATLKNSLTNVNFFQNNPKSKLEVSNPDLLDIKNAAIYDMRGRQVLNENNIGKVSSFSFPTHNLSSGVYIVKLTTTDNAILDYKITVHNR